MTDTSSSWLTKQPLTDIGSSVMAEISRPHDNLTQLSLISGAEQAREEEKKKEKEKLSLSHPDTQRNLWEELSPIKSNCIQKTTGVK
ncbi:hypothetical protein CEXT_551971 [Caerostris extrusa]|uniref:Uncharacterized protein n=1 Tax=Caerostris extrusa TaxID=172846 RepID=A0AAV4QLR0_CAEEX|nr:hypothetical protein CEXT_551971 [Caerostris extrusa]